MVSFFNKSYKTLNLIEINKKSLLNNFNFFQNYNLHSKVCPVLKSNAYGHGLTLIAKFFSSEIKPEFLCIDSLYEAYELDKEKIKTPILILGYTFPQNFTFKKLNFSLPIFDIETLEYLNKYQPGIKVHLKIDTGMNRLGIREQNYEKFAKALKQNPKVIVEGIYSHLSSADESDDGFSLKQILSFKKAIKFFEDSNFSFKWKHINATSGFIKFKDKGFNLARVGLGIYGISPFQEKSKENYFLENNLKPALCLKSHIVEIKELKKGEAVGYNGLFKAKKQTRIAILPLGYFEGLDRRLKNKGVVKIEEKYFPIIGNLCMNITIVDISELDKHTTGQEVVIFDNSNSSQNSIANVAKKCKTIPYEILVKINPTVKRILV